MKPYKCRVEYLESSGTQWIKTDYTLTSNTKIDVLFSPNQQTTANLWVIGSYVASNKLTGVRITGETTIDCYINTVVSKTVSGSNIGNKYQAVLDGKWTVNGSEGTAVTVSAGLSPLTLFGWNASTTANTYAISGLCSTKIYYCKIWDNGVLVRDFIPVLDNNGRPAMYDQVSGQLFYNQGTGEFTYGRKIIPVEYLESSGTQYIDTGFKGKNNLHYKTKVNFTTLSTSGSNGIGGEYLGNAAAYIGMVRANGHFTYLFNNTAVETTTTFYTNTDYVIDSTMNTGSQVVKVNGETISTGTISGTFTSTRNIFLFAICSTNEVADVYGSLKMHYCQIYDNDILVRDFIPCIDENNVPFMFDLVNCKVYENAGTGQFKVGANVEKSGNKNFLRKKLDIFLATLKKKRPYYCEVEYLEGTGTQYIDTGVIFSNSSHTYKWDIGAQAVNTSDSNYNWFCGFFEGGANSAGTYADTTSNYRFYAIGTYYQNGQVITSPLTNGDKYGIIRNVFTITNFAGTLPVILFGRNQSNGVKCEATKRVFYYKIYDNNILVRDMIPVLDWDMTPCMYDKVSGQLFYNQGSGTFQYGREIHYVDYLESTGTQYILTGFTPTVNTDFELELSSTKTSTNWTMGCPTWVGVHYKGADGQIGITNSSTSDFQQYINYARDNTRITMKLQGNTVYANGVSLGTITRRAGTLDFALFGYRDASRGATLLFTGSIYKCIIWDNNTLVRDYLPAIDENGVGFMFDSVTHTIFDNAGTGVFKYPAREVEYLQSSGTQYINTGYIPNTNTYVEMYAMYTSLDSTYRTPFSVRTSDGAANSLTISGATNTSNVYAFGSQYWAEANGCPDASTNVKYFMSLKSGVANFNGVTGNAGTNITPTSLTAYMFARNANGTASNFFKGNIYNCLIKENSTTIRDYIPVFLDGQAGMLDKQNNVFYSNAGTGDGFITGKIIEKEYE